MDNLCTSVYCQVANWKSARSVKVSAGPPRKKLMKGRVNVSRGMSGGWNGGSRRDFVSVHLVAGAPELKPPRSKPTPSVETRGVFFTPSFTLSNYNHGEHPVLLRWQISRLQLWKYKNLPLTLMRLTLGARLVSCSFILCTRPITTCCRIFVRNTKHGWHLPQHSGSSSTLLHSAYLSFNYVTTCTYT